MLLLGGDIGGTKTSLAVFSPESGPRAPLAEATFPSASYPCLEAIASEFLTHSGLQVDRASFGVAGPVVAGRATITNLPWVLDERQLQATLHVPTVVLLNDLTALAYAVPFLQSSDLDTLVEGQPVPGGAIAVIAPGTGLGEAFLVWDGLRYRPYGSEGGHSDFAPTNLLEIELLRYLLNRLPHVSYEQVCSGHGLPNIYAFLRDCGYAEEEPWLAEQLAVAQDQAPVIVHHALNERKRSDLCVTALDTFVSILGAEAGNLALGVLATGGVYLGGGIPPRILPALKQDQFMQAFRRKGRMSELVSQLPVHVILNPQAGLLGTACHGLGL